jgi:hypothetical protein
MHQSEGVETMSDLKHTPGPWIADRYDVRQSGSTGSRMVAAICYTGPHHTPASEYPKSCRLQDEANARLIAAAPELLEALEEMTRFCETGEYEGRDPLSAAFEAITKAKGEL